MRRMRLTGLVLALGFGLWMAAPAARAAQASDDSEAGGDSESASGDEAEGEDAADAADPWSAPDLPDPDEEPGADDSATAVPGPELPRPYPMAEIQRPFALAPLVLEPRFEVLLDFLSRRGADNQVALRAGAGFGAVEHLEAGLSFPLRLAPEVHAGDLELYGLYDLGWLIHDALELAGRLRLAIPLSDSYSYWYAGDFIMLADAPVKLRLLDWLALVGDVGLGFGLYPGDDAFLLFFDVGVLAQPIEPLALWWTVGAHVHAGGNYDSTEVPMHLRGQFTVIGDLDLWLDLAFPDLNEQGADWFQVVLGAAYRIGF
jgi:hypothetical protein